MINESNYNDFLIDDIGQLYKYNGKAEKVVIPAGVKIIGKEVFKENKQIQELIMPYGLAMVEKEAFAECTNLCKIVWSDTLSYIGFAAFRGCEKIKSVDLSHNLKVVDSFAFSGCSRLENIKFSSKTLNIGEEAFSGTKWLTDYPGDFVIIENGILINYKGCEREVVIPPEVHYIGGFAFFGNKTVRKIIMHSGMKAIFSEAFIKCYNLEEIVMSTSLNSIGKSAFIGCEKFSRVSYPGGFMMTLKNSRTEFLYEVYMIINRDYYVSYNPEVKNLLILKYFLSENDERAGMYAGNNADSIVSSIIRSKDAELLRKTMKKVPGMKRMNIEMLIEFAVESRAFEIAAELEEIRNSQSGY